jgi:hypothetical protein
VDDATEDVEGGGEDEMGVLLVAVGGDLALPVLPGGWSCCCNADRVGDWRYAESDDVAVRLTALPSMVLGSKGR